MERNLSTPAKRLVYRWFDEVWNEGREDVIDELLHPNIVAYGLTPDGSPMNGPAEFKHYFHALRNAFPDVKVTVEDTFEEGNKVAMRLLIVGTHTGEGLNNIAPTQKQVGVTAMVMSEIEDGQIVRAWNLVDNLSMMQQLGVL